MILYMNVNLKNIYYVMFIYYYFYISFTYIYCQYLLNIKYKIYSNYLINREYNVEFVVILII